MSCCYIAEFYQVGKDDKLHVHESPAEYKPAYNAFFSKTQTEGKPFMSKTISRNGHNYNIKVQVGNDQEMS